MQDVSLPGDIAVDGSLKGVLGRFCDCGCGVAACQRWKSEAVTWCVW